MNERAAASAWDWPRLERRARREARRVLRDGSQVDDAVQEALLRAWRHREKVSGDEGPEPWLARIARNEALRIAERSGAIGRREVALQAHHEAPAENALPAPEHFDLRRAIRPLPAQDRRLLALRYYADLSHPEVAAALDVPVGTVKVRLHRLRARLADRMEAQP